MKVECSCGAKYEFEIAPELRERPVLFVCPHCGVDASSFVDGLVRRELGQTASPVGEPYPVLPARPLRRSQLTITEPQAPATVTVPVPTEILCPKHPGQIAQEKC